MKNTCILLCIFICACKLSAQRHQLIAGIAHSGFSEDNKKYYYQGPPVLLSAGYKYIAGMRENHQLGFEFVYGIINRKYEWPGLGDYKIRRNYLAVNTCWDIVINPTNRARMMIGLLPSLAVMQRNTLVTSNTQIQNSLIPSSEQPVRFTLNLKPEISIRLSDHSNLNISGCVNLSRKINSPYRLQLSYGYLL